MQGSFEQAASAYGRAKLTPGWLGWPHLARAEAYERNEQPGKAVQAYRAFIDGALHFQLDFDLAPAHQRMEWLQWSADQKVKRRARNWGYGLLGIGALLPTLGGLAAVAVNNSDMSTGILVGLLVVIPLFGLGAAALVGGVIALIRSAFLGGVEPLTPPALSFPPAWRERVQGPIAPPPQSIPAELPAKVVTSTEVAGEPSREMAGIDHGLSLFVGSRYPLMPLEGGISLEGGAQWLGLGGKLGGRATAGRRAGGLQFAAQVVSAPLSLEPGVALGAGVGYTYDTVLGHGILMELEMLVFRWKRIGIRMGGRASLFPTDTFSIQQPEEAVELGLYLSGHFVP